MGRKTIWGLGLIAASMFLPVIVLSALAVLFTSQSTANASCTPNGSTILTPANIAVSGHGVVIDGEHATSEQLQVARLVIGEASVMHLSYRDALITVMTAIQESRLHNDHFGDQTSLGVFQQQDSWGTPSQRLNVVWATHKFISVLLTISDRSRKSLIEVAMEVQRPYAPDYEATFNGWLHPAQQLLALYHPTNGGSVPQNVAFDTGCAVGGSPNSKVEMAVQKALSQIGKPYVWGGESIQSGFDCSGLMQWAFAQAGITLPRVAADQYNVGTHVTKRELQRGDLVFWATNTADPRTIDHVALYLGKGQIVVAPHSGAFVEIEHMWTDSGGEHFIGGTRLATSKDVIPTSRLKWQLPVAQGSITDEFKAENGVDIAAPKDAFVVSAGDGTITTVRTNRLLGTFIRITNKDGAVFTYAHLNRFRKGVKVGATLHSGTIIAEVGSSGAGIGDRLLFTVQVKGKYVDPIQFLRARGVRPD